MSVLESATIAFAACAAIVHTAAGQVGSAVGGDTTAKVEMPSRAPSGARIAAQ